MGKVPANFHGVKGKSGRKSIRDERANLETLEKMYFETPSQDEIETKIRTGKFTIKDRHMLTALEGDVKAISIIFAKVFPDKLTIKAEQSISEFIDELDPETQGQELATQSPLPDSEQTGEASTIPTEPSAS